MIERKKKLKVEDHRSRISKPMTVFLSNDVSSKDIC